MSYDKLNIVHFSSEYEGAPKSRISYNTKGGLGVVIGDIARKQSQTHSVRVFLPKILREIGFGDPINPDGNVQLEYVKSEKSQFSKGEIGTHILNLPSSYTDKNLGKYVGNLVSFQNKAISILVELDKSNPIDILHLHDWHFGGLAQSANTAREAGNLNKDLRIVTTIHNGLYQGKIKLVPSAVEKLGIDGNTPWKNLEELCYDGSYSFLKVLLQNSDHVVTVSKTYAEKFHDRFPGLHDQSKKIHGIPNGIDFADFNIEKKMTPTQIRERKGETGKPILLIAGRLVEEKGIIEIISSLDTLSDKYEIHIIGDSSNTSIYSQIKAKESKSIIVKPYMCREEVIKEMAKAAVFLLPSTDLEPFGLAPIEALVSGAIPVVSNLGGLNDNFTDITDNQQTGNALIITNLNPTNNPENQHDLETSLEHNAKLIQEKLLEAHQTFENKMTSIVGSTLINNGRRQAREGRWSIDNCVEEYEKLYRSNIEK